MLKAIAAVVAFVTLTQVLPAVSLKKNAENTVNAYHSRLAQAVVAQTSDGQ